MKKKKGKREKNNGLNIKPELKSKRYYQQV